MPKIKTRRGAAKRFKITGSGKVRRRHAYLRHILSTKTRKQKRNLRQPALVSDSEAKAIKKTDSLLIERVNVSSNRYEMLDTFTL